MKLVTKEEIKQKFTPFNITLQIDNIGEARLLWNVFNHANVRSSLFANDYDPIVSNGHTADGFNGDDDKVRDFIRSKLESMGRQI